MGYETVDAIIRDHNSDPAALIGVLMDIQGEFNYLPKESLERVSQKLSVPLPNVYSVATFYKTFSLVPRGKHIVHVCMGTACHVRGAKRVLEGLERKLKVSAGETTEDRAFTLETVNCLGACALAPLVVMDEKNYSKVNANKMDKVVDGCKKADAQADKEAS
jgi:NADH-quinone oxidoreductase subunit E